MRMSILSAALLAITLGVSHAPAGEISRSQLAAIGLPGFKAMSYEQALAVRGKSITAIATGHSIAVGGDSQFLRPGQPLQSGEHVRHDAEHRSECSCRRQLDT